MMVSEAAQALHVAVGERRLAVLQHQPRQVLVVVAIESAFRGVVVAVAAMSL